VTDQDFIYIVGLVVMFRVSGMQRLRLSITSFQLLQITNSSPGPVLASYRVEHMDRLRRIACVTLLLSYKVPIGVFQSPSLS
jgi:hypothetical protein